jgi:putative sigma-54 modulation protein
MRLILTGRRVAITPALRDQVRRKLARLDRLLNDSAVSAQCVLDAERQSAICELSVHARGGHVLHGVGRHRSPGAAVTAAVDKVAEQAHRLADRWRTRRRGGASGARRLQTPGAGVAVPGAPGLQPRGDGTPADADTPPRVFRTREREVKPMSFEDALLLFSEGTRAFLVYRDASSERIAILYRRPDGHFGLIEPEA